MLHRVYDLFSDLERHQVLLSFKGELTPELVTALLGAVESQMAVLEPDQRLRKRVFNVLMECLQNLYHHKARNGASSAVDGTEGTQGVLMVARGVQGWQVLTGNFMAGAEVERLKEHLEKDRHLPNMPSRSEWEEHGTRPIGALQTGLWESVETQALYIAQLEQDLTTLEALAFGGVSSAEELDRLVAEVRSSRRLSEKQKLHLTNALRARYTKSSGTK